MRVLAPVVGKIAPLVRLLSSPVDGEVLGAVRAMGRVLASADLDFHYLADVVKRAALPVVIDQPRQEPTRAPEPKSWQSTAMDCLRCGAGRLNSTEMDFLRSMATLQSQPSGKQDRWLGAIAMSLGLGVTA